MQEPVNSYFRARLSGSGWAGAGWRETLATPVGQSPAGAEAGSSRDIEQPSHPEFLSS